MGKTPEENLNVLRRVQSLYEGAQPHWELVKKYDIIDFELGNKIAGAGSLSTREKEHDYNEL
jgi:seryl-tRNA synthetase